MIRSLVVTLLLTSPGGVYEKANVNAGPCMNRAPCVLSTAPGQDLKNQAPLWQEAAYRRRRR
ncbi:MAG: hypothetical protein ACR652_24220 [Methylocystis sp.]|uniref:hypothetical protein n=1 Tax=Methylocystis sp. TaxID=1911079 RepID=UPI003DA62F36